MKKIALILLFGVLLVITGCGKNLYLPESESDRVFTTVGIEEEIYYGDGYTISIPSKSYRYEKDYEDGSLEETWKNIKKDDAEVKVITYKNTDEISARNKFLKDNDEYIFEDLMGYSLCGVEPDGDMLWFRLYESNGTVYVISWEYSKDTSEELKKELSNIAETFMVAQ